MDVIQWFEGLNNLGEVAGALILLVKIVKSLDTLFSGSKEKPAAESFEKSFA